MRLPFQGPHTSRQRESSGGVSQRYDAPYRRASSAPRRPADAVVVDAPCKSPMVIAQDYLACSVDQGGEYARSVRDSKLRAWLRDGLRSSAIIARQRALTCTKSSTGQSSPHEGFQAARCTDIRR
jgi:hypothetical protein